MRVYEKIKMNILIQKQNLITEIYKNPNRKETAFVISYISIIGFTIVFMIGILFIKIWINHTELVPIYKYYTCIPIEKGDTLWSIAKEYLPDGNDAELLYYIQKVKELNQLSSDTILEGNHLLIFYYSTEYK